jgi:hypothetical protein
MAAQEIVSVQTRYAKQGKSLCEAALYGSKQFVEWQHYPRNDLVDSDSGYEFYYHSHESEGMLNGEHGHFHLFKRSTNTPEKFHHLIGIALNQQGLPVRIFTTNQWVTGESMVDAKAVIKALRGFDVVTKGRAGPIARWVSAFTKLFYLEMEKLIHQRDERINQLKVKVGNLPSVLQSKKHHVITECKIDLLNRLSEHLLVVN